MTLHCKTIVGCLRYACFKCCDDMTCKSHQERRKKERIYDGTAPANMQAARKRSLAIRTGTFRESAFRYLGETLLVWNFNDFMAVPKWRNDAIRRSKRHRNMRLNVKNGTGLLKPVTKHSYVKDRRDKFHAIFKDLHTKNTLTALCEQKDSMSDGQNTKQSLVASIKN